MRFNNCSEIEPAAAQLPARGPHLTGGLALVDHPAVLAFSRWVAENYIPPEGADCALFLPCSAQKPYSASRTHRAVAREIERLPQKRARQVHILTLSEPLGIVPHEMENLYPADSYDLTLSSWLTPSDFSNRALLSRREDKSRPARVRVPLTSEDRAAMNLIAERVGRFLVKTNAHYQTRIGYVRGTQKWLLKRGARLAGVGLQFPLDDPEFGPTRVSMGVANWALNGLRAPESLKQLVKVILATQGDATTCALDVPATSSRLSPALLSRAR